MAVIILITKRGVVTSRKARRASGREGRRLRHLGGKGRKGTPFKVHSVSIVGGWGLKLLVLVAFDVGGGMCDL